MKPVMQTILHGGGQCGNCVQACIASLFELRLGAVPHFFVDAHKDDGVAGWGRFRDWLDQRGIYPRFVAVLDEGHGPQPAWDFPHLARGLSPRGVQHQVIRKGFEIIHDPHPDGGGVVLEEVTELLVADPPRYARFLREVTT